MPRHLGSRARTLRASNLQGMRDRPARACRLMPLRILGAALTALIANSAMVPSAQAGAGPCRVPSTTYPTIQAAVNAATCATINVAAGTYPEHVTIARNVAIRGEGQGSTVVDGGGIGTVVTIAGGTVMIMDVTIQNGVHDRLVSDGLGGGIANFGMLTIRNSTITGNSAGIGGGIVNFGTAIVMNSTIAGNSAVISGGINNDVGTLTIRNSTIAGNGADNGGGIQNNAGTLTVENSTIDGNSADIGGGIRNAGVGAIATLTNSTLIGNTADFVGGGISNESVGTIATLTNSTLIGNTAGSDGGGIYNTDGATVTLTRVTFENNTPNDCTGCAGLP